MATVKVSVHNKSARIVKFLLNLHRPQAGQEISNYDALELKPSQRVDRLFDTKADSDAAHLKALRHALSDDIAKHLIDIGNIEVTDEVITPDEGAPDSETKGKGKAKGADAGA